MATDISVVVIEVVNSKGKTVAQHRFQGPKPQNASELKQFQAAVSRVIRDWDAKYDWKSCRSLGIAVPPSTYNPQLGPTNQVVYQ